MFRQKSEFLIYEDKELFVSKKFILKIINKVYIKGTKQSIIPKIGGLLSRCPIPQNVSQIVGVAFLVYRNLSGNMQNSRPYNRHKNQKCCLNCKTAFLPDRA